MALTLREGVVLRQVLLPYLFLQVDQWSGEENDVSWTGRKKGFSFSLLEAQVQKY